MDEHFSWFYAVLAVTVDRKQCDKNIDMSKMEVFKDELNVSQMIPFVLDSIENIERKGEYAGYKHFLLFFTRF